MEHGFWEKIKKPILALAPMEDVTDEAFRRIIAKYGKPDVMFTEFTSCDGLVSEKGHRKMLTDLWYSEEERPIVAQVFGADPENFYKAAQMIKKLGFDGIDINMGCPVNKIVNSDSCSALIKNPRLAQEIIFATKKGAEGIPISVKTRLGWNKNEIETWIPALLLCEPAVLTIHGRTRKQMSQVPADWNAIARCVDIRDGLRSKTLIVGNGDVADVRQATEYADRFKVDGVMIGRGIFGNPWLFSSQGKQVTPKEKLLVMLEHTRLFEELFQGIKNFQVMKKHYKAYVSGWAGAKNLRVKLMMTYDSREVESIVHEYLKKI